MQMRNRTSLRTHWRTASSTATPRRPPPLDHGESEAIAIARDIVRCTSVEALTSHYRRHQYQYRALNHLAALNQVAVLDPRRAATEVAASHAAVLDKFIAPELHRLAPRELACWAYLLAVYGLPLPSLRVREQLVQHVDRQLSSDEWTSVPPLDVWTGSARPPRPRGLTALPPECFRALHGSAEAAAAGGGGAPQDVALAAWALAKVGVASARAFASLTAAAAAALRPSATPSLTPIRRGNSAGVHSTPPGVPVPPALPAARSVWFTDDSVVRLAWACGMARYNVRDTTFAQALDDAVTSRLREGGTAVPASASLVAARNRRVGGPALGKGTAASSGRFTFAQRVLLAWGFVHMGVGECGAARELVRHVFDPDTLELSRYSMSMSTQEHVVDLYAALKRSAAATAALRPSDGLSLSGAAQTGAPFGAALDAQTPLPDALPLWLTTLSY